MALPIGPGTGHNAAEHQLFPEAFRAMSASARTIAVLMWACLCAAVLSAQTLPSTQSAPAASTQLAAPTPKPDALLLYRQGRDLEVAGREVEAQAKFARSVEICDQELAADPKRLEAYVVKCWSLFRLGRHQEVMTVGQAALKLQFDPRISEVMGESSYHLGNMNEALKYFQRYIETTGENGDRVSTAYFYMGETYLKLKRYSHADIAYSTAVAKEPNMPRWWFRLGGVCELLGEWRRAYDAYAKALALNPSYKDALEAQARVKPRAGL
jgi:tetratricopeptide (TPR) repeat protein